MFYYGTERIAEHHRHELMQAAGHEREINLHVDPPAQLIRKPMGRFLVRIGGRLLGEPQPARQGAGSPNLATQ